MPDAEIDAAGIVRIAADHAVIIEHGADVGGIVIADALGIDAAALFRGNDRLELLGRRTGGDDRDYEDYFPTHRVILHWFTTSRR